MHPKIVRYARRWLDVDAAGEVANDTMRSLHAKAPANPRSDEENRRLQSLCYRISEGLIKNELRAERRRDALFRALSRQNEAEFAVQHDFSDGVLGDAEVSRLLGELSPTDQTVLSLLLDGYRVSEMALVLECTPAAATMRLKRAKENLKLLLRRDGHWVEVSDEAAR